jgi:hypothetical protein
VIPEASTDCSNQPPFGVAFPLLDNPDIYAAIWRGIHEVSYVGS